MLRGENIERNRERVCFLMQVKNGSFYILIDMTSVAAAYFVTLAAFYGFPGGDMKWYGLVVILSICLIADLLFGREKSLAEEKKTEVFFGALRQTMYMGFLFALFLFFLEKDSRELRIFFILLLMFSCICLNLGRMYCRAVICNYYGSRKNKIRLLVFANRSNVLETVRKLSDSHLYKYDLIAAAVVDGRSGDTKLKQLKQGPDGFRLADDLGNVTEFLKKQAVDEVLISLTDSGREYINGLLRKFQSMGIIAHVATNSLGLSEEEKQVGEVGTYRVLTYGPRIFSPSELALKRCMDIAGSLAGLLITVIVSLFVVPAIWIESPGPALFRQTRVGKNGRKFSIYKFRSMYMNAEERKKELMRQNEMKGLMFKIKDDPRITRVGKFIRKTSIDELPQFFNVLMGDMSLVGTRPPTIDEFERYEEHHKRRLSLKPGITGMWQVSGRNNINDFEDVVKLDLEYIDNWSIWLDIKIIFQTVLVVLFHKGAE